MSASNSHRIPSEEKQLMARRYLEIGELGADHVAYELAHEILRLGEQQSGPAEETRQSAGTERAPVAWRWRVSWAGVPDGDWHVTTVPVSPNDRLEVQPLYATSDGA